MSCGEDVGYAGDGRLLLFVHHLGVDLRGGDLAVAKELRHGVDVGVEVEH